MIRTQSLTKVFKVGFRGRSVTALKDLDLEVKKGEIFGFLGPNGAGKTTTIKLLMGLIYPTSGWGRIMGRDLNDVEAKDRIGFLPENPYFYDYLTGREFLRFYTQLLKIQKGERDDRIREIFSLVGLKGAEDLQLRRYSKGMIQRIGIAQALLNDPDLVVLDEPMSGLDPIGRKEVRDIILRLKSEGKTVFFSTHILPDVEMICDRVGILIGGSLRAVGNIDELIGHNIDAIEVTARGLSEASLSEISPRVDRVFKKDENNLFTLKDEENLDRVITLIYKNGGRVYSVIPQRASLEDFFMKEAGEGGKG